MSLAQECAAYFRTKSYDRLMRELLTKYKSHGRIVDVIHIPVLSANEVRDLQCFVNKPITDTIVKIQVQNIRKHLDKTRFAGVELEELVATYFNIPLTTKGEDKAKRAQQKVLSQDNAKRWVLDQIETPSCRSWLTNSSMLVTPRNQSSVLNACRAVEWLESHSEDTVRLAVLAANTTGNPHELDTQTDTFRFLLQILEFTSGSAPTDKSASARAAFLSKHRIIIDSISSTVSQVGLILEGPEGELPAWKVMRESSEPVTLSLMNLRSIQQARSPSGRVYIVENEMLFSQLCDRATVFHSPLICTSGQLSIACTQLLDLLASSGTTLYYSGDFDGDGLSIAEKLCYRYAPQLKFWRMTPTDFEKAKSNTPISNPHQTKLSHITGSELSILATTIQHSGVLGYQELLLQDYLSDLTNIDFDHPHTHTTT